MTPAQEPTPVLRRTDAGDRAQWLTLRRAAHLGQLQPEGFELVDQLHDRHPEWRKEWSL